MLSPSLELRSLVTYMDGVRVQYPAADVESCFQTQFPEISECVLHLARGQSSSTVGGQCG